MWLIFLRKQLFSLETKLAIVNPSQRHATRLSCTAEGGISLASCPQSHPDFPVTQDSVPEHTTGILPPKPPIQNIVKPNFKLTVKPQDLITALFFFFPDVLKLGGFACISTLNEACEWKQKNTCAWIHFLQVHIIQLIAPSPEVLQTAFTHSGNSKGKTISFMKCPINCTDT